MYFKLLGQKWFALILICVFNVVGDSAGGNLATSVAMILRDTNFHPQPKLQVLLYPALQAVDFHTPSYHIGKNLATGI